MPATMKAVLRVETSGAATHSATHTIPVEAYDRIEVTVPSDAPGTATVEVQPGDAGQVRLLMITATSYPADDDGAQLTYAVDGGDPVALDAPLLVAGAGAVGVLGAVNDLVFTNTSDAPVDVVVLVGRRATTA